MSFYLYSISTKKHLQFNLEVSDVLTNLTNEFNFYTKVFHFLAMIWIYPNLQIMNPSFTNKVVYFPRKWMKIQNSYIDSPLLQINSWYLSWYSIFAMKDWKGSTLPFVLFNSSLGKDRIRDEVEFTIFRGYITLYLSLNKMKFCSRTQSILFKLSSIHIE